MNRVLFPFTVLPKAMLFMNLDISNFTPLDVNSSRRSCEVWLPPPKVKKKNPSGVYSVTNLWGAVTYVPTLIPTLSGGEEGSSTKTSFCAKASTSYHLFANGDINSEELGSDWYPTPGFCIIDVTDIIFFSGKNNLKNGLLLLSSISFLNILVVPFTITSLLVIV